MLSLITRKRRYTKRVIILILPLMKPSKALGCCGLWETESQLRTLPIYLAISVLDKMIIKGVWLTYLLVCHYCVS